MSVDNVKYNPGPELHQCGSVPAQNDDFTGNNPGIHSESSTRLESSPGAEAPSDVERREKDEHIRGEPSTTAPETVAPIEPEATSGPSPAPPATETFDESLLDAMEEKAATIRVGEMIRGKLIALTEEWALVDIGYKTEGTFPRDELQASPEEVTIGSEIYVTIKEIEGPNGYVGLSYKDALQKQAWQRVQAAYAEGTPVKGRISERVKGGFKVNLGGIEAFLPASQLNLFQVRNLDAWVGKEIEAKVLKLNRRQFNIVISRRALLEEEQARRRAEALAQLDEAYIVQGRIKSLTDYGAFVDLGGIDGLLHITDMSWKHIQHPKEMFKVGDIIQVKILKLDRDKGRINLGYKQLFPDPWDTIPERYPVGSRVKGKVTRVVNYGAFVELEEGIQGLIHVSEMSWDKRLKHPSKYVKAGDEVLVEVVAVDPAERRLSLSLRRLEPDPWTLFAETHSPGTKVKGIVRGLTDFGAFVEIEKGIEGLVHVSDLSRRRIKHPSEIVKKGQEVEAIIQNIDLANRKLSLSMKELEPDPWETFFNTHQLGDVVKGKIARFASFGAFVDLGDGVEGLCHISELSDERVEKPEDVVEIGQELEFRILRLDRAQRRIGLSTRAAGESIDTSGFTVNTDTGGLASLGEIAKLEMEKREE